MTADTPCKQQAMCDKVTVLPASRRFIAYHACAVATHKNGIRFGFNVRRNTQPLRAQHLRGFNRLPDATLPVCRRSIPSSSFGSAG